MTGDTDHTPELIASEFGRCASLRWADAQRFIGDGIPLQALISGPFIEFDFVARDRVIFDRGGTFEFERHCKRQAEAVGAFVVVARDERGDPVDIVAWRENRVARWLGRAAVLGGEQIDIPRMGEPLVTHASVRDWMRAGRRGIMVLDDQRAADLLRHDVLQVETNAFARDLRNRLTVPAPHIAVVPAMRAAA